MKATLTVLPPYADPSSSYATGGGEFDLGEVATLTAYPSAGHVFTHWSCGDDIISHDNPIRVNVTEDATYTAHFSNAYETPEDEGDDPPPSPLPTYEVVATCLVPGEGIVTGSGTYEQGASCTIAATENPATPNHVFCGWYNNGWPGRGNGKLLKRRAYTFAVFDNETWVAVFDDDGPSSYPDWTDQDEHDYEESKKGSRRNLIVNVESAGGGEVEGGGSFYAGETCTLRATPDTSESQDMSFLEWVRYDASGNKILVRTPNPYSFQVYEDQDWIGYFGSHLIKISVESNLTVLPSTRDRVYYTAAPYIDNCAMSDPPNSGPIKVARYNYGRIGGDLIHEVVIPGGVLHWDYDIKAECCIKADSGQYPHGLYYPVWAENMTTGEVVYNSIPLAQWIDNSYGSDYSYETFFTQSNSAQTPSSNQRWYVYFIRVDGSILRNAQDEILRDSDAIILRGEG